MLDPLLSLCMSVSSNKGIFALLLGSGISSAAGIPTGWDIVKDLIRQIATLNGEDCSTDSVAWYVDKYGVEPNYSALLNDVAKSPTERCNLLKDYFEPTDEERKNQIKTPTRAHKAIASLVLTGHIKVILTTNFDTLMEQALQEVGISPSVISTVDSIQGTLPIVHSPCTIIKLHGDYRDTRIKNTFEELQTYELPMNELLDKVLDEFGLIICGWSADWDFALIDALKRCKSRRFTTYWTSRSEPSDNARRVIVLRKAELIRIKDANDFFDSMNEKVRSLEELMGSHPLAAKVAVASLKRYILDPTHKIRLHDLVMVETERLCKLLSDEFFPSLSNLDQQEFVLRLKRYDSVSETIRMLFATGCFWGDNSQNFLWVKSLTKITNAWKEYNGLSIWLDLSLYPALLAMYAGGIASVAQERYGLLHELLVKSIVLRSGCEQSAVQQINPFKVFSDSNLLLPGTRSQYTPGSQYIYEILRNCFKDILPNDRDYERTFDKFEYLLALIFLDLRLISNPSQEDWVWSPYGSYAWKRFGGNDIINKVFDEAYSMGADWPVIKQGLFGGSMDRFQKLREVHNNFLKKVHF